MFVGAGLYFATFFSKLFSGTNNLKICWQVIPSGNSHLHSTVLEMILTFFGTIESSSLLSNSEEELDD